MTRAKFKGGPDLLATLLLLTIGIGGATGQITSLVKHLDGDVLKDGEYNRVELLVKADQTIPAGSYGIDLYLSTDAALDPLSDRLLMSQDRTPEIQNGWLVDLSQLDVLVQSGDWTQRERDGICGQSDNAGLIVHIYNTTADVVLDVEYTQPVKIICEGDYASLSKASVSLGPNDRLHVDTDIVLTVDVTVHNFNMEPFLADQDNFQLQVYVNEDMDPTASPVKISTAVLWYPPEVFLPLQPGSSRSLKGVKVRVRLPANQASGQEYFMVKVVPPVGRSDDVGNDFAVAPETGLIDSTIGTSEYQDAVVTAFSLDPPVFLSDDDQVVISAEVDVTVGSSAQQVDVGEVDPSYAATLYWSMSQDMGANTRIESGINLVVNGYPVRSGEGPVTHTIARTGTISVPTDPKFCGNVYAILVADSQKSLQDPDRADNIAAIPVLIQCNPSDVFAVTGLSVSGPSKLWAGVETTLMLDFRVACARPACDISASSQETFHLEIRGNGGQQDSWAVIHSGWMEGSITPGLIYPFQGDIENSTVTVSVTLPVTVDPAKCRDLSTLEVVVSTGPGTAETDGYSDNDVAQVSMAYQCSDLMDLRVDTMSVLGQTLTPGMATPFDATIHTTATGTNVLSQSDIQHYKFKFFLSKDQMLDPAKDMEVPYIMPLWMRPLLGESVNGENVETELFDASGLFMPKTGYDAFCGDVYVSILLDTYEEDPSDNVIGQHEEGSEANNAYTTPVRVDCPPPPSEGSFPNPRLVLSEPKFLHDYKLIPAPFPVTFDITIDNQGMTTTQQGVSNFELRVYYSDDGDLDPAWDVAFDVDFGPDVVKKAARLEPGKSMRLTGLSMTVDPQLSRPRCLQLESPHLFIEVLPEDSTLQGYLMHTVSIPLKKMCDAVDISIEDFNLDDGPEITAGTPKVFNLRTRVSAAGHAVLNRYSYHFYLSHDEMLDPEDIEIPHEPSGTDHTQLNLDISGLTYHTLQHSFGGVEGPLTIDQYYPYVGHYCGWTYLGVEVRIEEASVVDLRPYNNIQLKRVFLQCDGDGLGLSDVTFDPAPARYYAENVEVKAKLTFTVTNLMGTRDIPEVQGNEVNFHVKFYLSDDIVFDGEDEELLLADLGLSDEHRQMMRAGLARDNSLIFRDIPVTFTPTADMCQKTHLLFAVLRGAGMDVADAVDANNFRAIPFPCYASEPVTDISVSTFTVNSAPDPNADLPGSFSLTAEVTLGDLEAITDDPVFGIEFYLSNDNTLDTSDLPLNYDITAQMSALSDNITSDGTITLDAGNLLIPPDSRFCGSVYILVQLDPLNAISEADKLNNIKDVRFTYNCDNDLFKVTSSSFATNKKYHVGIPSPVTFDLAMEYLHTSPLSAGTADNLNFDFKLYVQRGSKFNRHMAIPVVTTFEFTDSEGDARFGPLSQGDEEIFTQVLGMVEIPNFACEANVDHLFVSVDGDGDAEDRVEENNVAGTMISIDTDCSDPDAVDLATTNFTLDRGSAIQLGHAKGFVMRLDIMVTGSAGWLQGQMPEGLSYQLYIRKTTADPNEALSQWKRIAYNRQKFPLLQEDTTETRNDLDFGDTDGFVLPIYDYLPYCGSDSVIKVVMDDSRVLDETDEGNNEREVDITVQSDMCASDNKEFSIVTFELADDADTIDIGDTVQYDLRVAIMLGNTGSLSAGNSRIRYSHVTLSTPHFGFKLIMSPEMSTSHSDAEELDPVSYTTGQDSAREDGYSAGYHEVDLNGDYTFLDERLATLKKFCDQSVYLGAELTDMGQETESGSNQNNVGWWKVVFTCNGAGYEFTDVTQFAVPQTNDVIYEEVATDMTFDFKITNLGSMVPDSADKQTNIPLQVLLGQSGGSVEVVETEVFFSQEQGHGKKALAHNTLTAFIGVHVVFEIPEGLCAVTEEICISYNTSALPDFDDLNPDDHTGCVELNTGPNPTTNCARDIGIVPDTFSLQPHNTRVIWRDTDTVVTFGLSIINNGRPLLAQDDGGLNLGLELWVSENDIFDTSNDTNLNAEMTYGVENERMLAGNIVEGQTVTIVSAMATVNIPRAICEQSQYICVRYSEGENLPIPIRDQDSSNDGDCILWSDILDCNGDTIDLAPRLLHLSNIYGESILYEGIPRDFVFLLDVGITGTTMYNYTAHPFSIKFSLSEDDTVDPTDFVFAYMFEDAAMSQLDQVLGPATDPADDPVQSFILDLSGHQLTIPALGTETKYCGNTYLSVIVDADGILSEKYENNNQLMVPILFFCQKDLYQVLGATLHLNPPVQRYVWADSSLEVTLDVQLQYRGARDLGVASPNSENFFVKLYASNDRMYRDGEDTNLTPLDGWTLPMEYYKPIKAGQTIHLKGVKGSLRGDMFDKVVCSITRHFLLRVQKGPMVSEEETVIYNNVVPVVFPPALCVEEDYRDLAVKWLHVPEVIGPNDQILVRITASVSKDQSAPTIEPNGFVYTLYLSMDRFWDEEDLAIGTFNNTMAIITHGMDIDLTKRMTLNVQDQRYCRPVWAILWLDSEDVIEEPLELNNFAEQQVTVVCSADVLSLVSLNPLSDNGPVLLLEGVESPVQLAVQVSCTTEDCSIPPVASGENFLLQVDLVDESLSTVSNLATIDGSWTDGLVHPDNALGAGFHGLGSTIDMIISTELTVGDCSSIDQLRITVQPHASLGLDSLSSNNWLLMPVNCQQDSGDPDLIVTDFSFVGSVDYTQDGTSFIPYTLQVKNAGPVDIPAYILDWDFYLSESPVIDHERDVLLEYMKTSMQMNVIQEELMPDTTADTSDLGKGFILPSIRCGRWYVGVIAGDTKPEEEKLCSNNIRVQPIDVICPNDVYSIDAGNFQQSTFYIWKEAPAKVTFDLTVTNVGLNDIPASAEQTNFDIGLALSSDGMLDSHDYILDTSIQYSGAESLLQYASHQQGESFAFHGLSAEITIPDATCDAARFLIVFVVSESDSILVNNDAALQLRPSCSVASADIQADEISVTGPLTPNVAVDFTLAGKVLVNLGAAVKPFNYKLWLSLDDELDPLEDLDLKYPLPQGRPFPSALTETENRLDLSGTTRTGSGLHIPADVDRRYCGWIYIIAQLDSNNTAHELDENNNIAVTNEPVELTCEEDVFSVSLLKFYPSQRYLWNGVFTPVKVQVTVTCHIDSCPTASESSDHFQLDVLAASDEMETYSVALSWDGSMTSNPEDAQMADFSELRSLTITLEGGLKLDTDDDTCKQLKHLGVRLSNGSSEEVTDLDFAAVPENDVQWAAAEFVCASDETIDLSITSFGLTSPEYSFQSPSGFAMILQVLITEQNHGISSVFGDQLNFDFDLFLSDDETLDMDDIMVHHDKSSVRPYLQGALSNGLTLDLGGAMQFSQEDYATFCGRDMHLIVKVDSRDIDPSGRQKGQLAENLEGNNIASTPITLVNCTTQLDLSVEAFSVSDSDVVQAGSPLTLSLSVDIVSVDIDTVFSKKTEQEQNYNFRLILSQDETLDPTGDEPSSCLLYREAELMMRMETCEAECAMSGDYTQCVQQCVGQMWAMSHDCLTDLADDADIPDLVLPFSTTQIPQLQEEVMHPYVTDNLAMNKTGNSTTVSHTITSGDTAPFLQLPHRGYVCNRYWHIGVDVFVTEEAERTETSTQNIRALQRIYVFCPADSLSLLSVHFMGEFQYKRKVWADVSYPISYSILLGNLGKDNIPPAAAHRSNFYIDLYFSEDEFFDAEEDKWLGTSESPEGIGAGLVKQIGPMPGTLRLTMDECEASKRTANMFVVVRPSMDLQLDSVPINNYIGTPISPYTVYGLCTIPGRLDLGITRFELVDDHVIHTNQPKPFLLEVDLQVDGLARLFGANQDDPSGLSWGFRFVLLSSKDQDPFTEGIRLHHNYSTENRDILRQGVSSNVIHQFNSHGLTLQHEDFGVEPLCGVAYLAAIVWPQRPNMARIDPVRSNDVMTIEVLLKCDGDVMDMENFQVRTVLPQMFIAPDAPTLVSFDADLINLSPHPIMANLKEDNFIFKAYLSVTPTLDLHSFEYWDLQLELLPSPQAYGHPMHPKAPMVDIQGQLNGAMSVHGHIRLKDVVGYVTMPAEACDEAEYLMVAVHTQPSLPYTETIFHNNYMAYPINQFTNLKCSGTSDLIITDFSLLSVLRRRRSLSDEDKVVEQGQPKRISIDVSSGSFSDDDYSLKFYISKDSDWDPIDQEIVYNEGSETLTIPSYTDQQYCGMAYLVAVVDGDNSVEESSEHNNQASLEILYQCAEDLFVLSDVSMNPTEKKVYFLDVTNTLSLDYTVHHLGSQAITGITTPPPPLATTTAQPNTTTTPMPLQKTFDIKVYLHDSDDLDQGMPVEIPTWAAVYQAGSAYDMSRTLDTGETVQHSLEMPVTLNEDICEGNPTKVIVKVDEGDLFVGARDGVTSNNVAVLDLPPGTLDCSGNSLDVSIGDFDLSMDKVITINQAKNFSLDITLDIKGNGGQDMEAENHAQPWMWDYLLKPQMGAPTTAQGLVTDGYQHILDNLELAITIHTEGRDPRDETHIPYFLHTQDSHLLEGINIISIDDALLLDENFVQYCTEEPKVLEVKVNPHHLLSDALPDNNLVTISGITFHGCDGVVDFSVSAFDTGGRTGTLTVETHEEYTAIISVLVTDADILPVGEAPFTVAMLLSWDDLLSHDDVSIPFTLTPAQQANLTQDFTSRPLTHLDWMADNLYIPLNEQTFKYCWTRPYIILQVTSNETAEVNVANNHMATDFYFQCGRRDMDECRRNLHNCDLVKEICINTKHRFDCVCRSGYQENAIGQCEDIDECAAMDHRGLPTHGCSGSENFQCVNIPGSYKCSCAQGFTEIGDACVDVDECEVDPCHDIATCTNTAGSFICQCPDLYEGNGLGADGCRDEKNCDNHRCLNGGICEELDPGYECICPMPYWGEYCQSVDGGWGAWGEWSNCSADCMMGYKTRSRLCDSPSPRNGGQACHMRSLGGVEYSRCYAGPCPENAHDPCNLEDNICGHVGGGGLCTVKTGDGVMFPVNTTYPVCDCKPGYSWEGQEGENIVEGFIRCTDVDECATGDHDCPVAETDCVNTRGGYSCVCKEGFIPDPEDPTSCIDVNECTATAEWIPPTTTPAPTTPAPTTTRAPTTRASTTTQGPTTMMSSTHAPSAAVNQDQTTLSVAIATDNTTYGTPITANSSSSNWSTVAMNATGTTSNPSTSAMTTVLTTTSPPTTEMTTRGTTLDPTTAAVTTLSTAAMDSTAVTINSTVATGSTGMSATTATLHMTTAAVNTYTVSSRPDTTSLPAVPPVQTTAPTGDNTLDDCTNSAECVNRPGSYSCRCEEGYRSVGKGRQVECKVSTLLPYGPNAGDVQLNKTNPTSQATSPLIPVPGGVPLYDGRNHLYAYVSENGFIGVTDKGMRPAMPFAPHPAAVGVLAAYWSDARFHNIPMAAENPPKVWYRAYTQREAAPNIFDSVEHWVRDYASDDADYMASFVMVATWENVRPPWRADQTSTFQAVLTTDGSYSYAIYLYEKEAMGWNPRQYYALSDIHAAGDRMVRVGYSVEMDDTDREEWEVTSATWDGDINGMNVFRMDTWLSPTVQEAVPGVVFYRLDANTMEDVSKARQCMDWYKTAESSAELAPGLLDTCPPTMAHVRLDAEVWEANYMFVEYRYNCCRRHLDNHIGANIRCCYDTYVEGNPLVTEDYISAGHVLKSVNEDRDWDARGWCCNVETPNEFCHLYNKKRPPASSRKYRPTRQATMFGDPHFISMDQRTFTFNGHGEYVLARTLSGWSMTNGEDFMLQARTAPAPGGTGATILTAIAGREGSENSPSIQVYLHSDGDQLVVRNGTDNITESQTSARGSVLVTQGSQIVDVLAQFPSGMYFHVKTKAAMLFFTVGMPSSFQGYLEGIMGNFDGDDGNDFRLSDGTVLGTDATEQNILDFGKSWSLRTVSQADGIPVEEFTLFDWYDGSTAADYGDDQYQPRLMSDMSLDNPAHMAVCRKSDGTVSQECMYDIAVTGDQDVGQATVWAQDQYWGRENTTSNSAPIIIAPSEIHAEVGSAVSLTIEVSDPNPGDVLNITVQGGELTSFLYTEDGTVRATFTWTPTVNDLYEVTTIRFKAVDDKGAVTVASPQTIVCYCNGYGTCDFSSLSYRQGMFGQAVCFCKAAFIGDMCQEQIDMCQSEPCYPGGRCIPDPNGDAGYICNSQCPEGLTGDGQNCEDRDECLEVDSVTGQPTHGCGQDCVNFPGSYACTCQEGYRITGDTRKRCENINECESPDLYTCPAHLVCVDTTPGYRCGCQSGHHMDRYGRCVDTDECLVDNGGCQKLCVNTAGSYQCECGGDYVLAEDGMTCIDTDPCEGQNECDHICVDKEGWHHCDCHEPYHLLGDGATCAANETCDSRWCTPDDVAVCSKIIDAFWCHCPRGYRKVRNNCEDINECIEGSSRCSQRCVNQPGYYTCECVAGYRLAADGRTCLDVDECEDDNGGCGDMCENYPGGFRCACSPGYDMTPVNYVPSYEPAPTGLCHDVDECLYNLHMCGPNAKCSNTIGSYTCTCEAGFQLQSDGVTCLDMNECASDNGQCSDLCVNLEGSYRCACRTGGKLRPNGKDCEDIDECTSVWLNRCRSTAYCVDKVRGYDCHCTEGYRRYSDRTGCNSAVWCPADWEVKCDYRCLMLPTPVSNPASNRCTATTTSAPPAAGTTTLTTVTTATTTGPQSTAMTSTAGPTTASMNSTTATSLNISLTPTTTSLDSTAVPTTTSLDSTTVPPSTSLDSTMAPTTTSLDSTAAASRAATATASMGSTALTSMDNTTIIMPSMSSTAAITPSTGLTTAAQAPAGMMRTECVEDAVEYVNVPTCVCQRGKQLAADGRSCEDVDECALSPPVCGDPSVTHAICENKPGYYLCNCQSGYVMDVDKKACTLNSGGWGPWSDWGQCSKTCDLGMQSRTRVCDSPEPSFGLPTCQGSSTDVQMCAGNNCPLHSTEKENAVFLKFEDMPAGKYPMVEAALRAKVANLVNRYCRGRGAFPICCPQASEDQGPNRGDIVGVNDITFIPGTPRAVDKDKNLEVGIIVHIPQQNDLCTPSDLAMSLPHPELSGQVNRTLTGFSLFDQDELKIALQKGKTDVENVVGYAPYDLLAKPTAAESGTPGWAIAVIALGILLILVIILIAVLYVFRWKPKASVEPDTGESHA
ncbi:SCUBE3 [Branchiostoma lanceolatum]|uniref:SCUBE3 protein n=1 Tax=Branchiostoma lanceolatum TaxID=7740 RepID=A0A8J9ZGF5_BRALA|nr:SCUBE3 [Branchiostoma lanceolatum]